MTRSKQQADEVVRIEVPARPRKRPRQMRSVALVEALKATGRELLEGHGREGLTVQELSERSGVAVSSIYEYYPTLTELRIAAGIFAVGFLVFTLMLKVAVPITLGEFRVARQGEG